MVQHNALYLTIHFCELLPYSSKIFSNQGILLVFTKYNGIETFALTHEFNIKFRDGTEFSRIMDDEMYGKIKGPYNFKNVIGASLTHLPFTTDEKLSSIRNDILKYAICSPENIISDFGIENKDIKQVDIIIMYRPKGDVWTTKLIVNCN